MKKVTKMNYAIDVTKTIKLTDGIIDGMTKKKAASLKGTWIKLNPATFALVEETNLTVVKIVEDEIGCACNGFTKADTSWMCEHLIAFKDLKNDPQVSIQSPEYRWLQAYLFTKGWSAEEDRWLYPSLAAPAVESEAVAELPAVDPVNADKPLDIGVEKEPVIDEKTYSRKCAYCGEIISGTDLAQVKLDIAEHIRGCTKNPANKKKSPKPVVKESVTPENPTVAESAPVEKQSKTEEKNVKPSTAVAKQEPGTPAVEREMPTESQFQTAAVGRLMKNQGSIYKVSGKDVADSAAVSNYAVSAGVSTETIVLEQTAEYARATVRAHKGGRYTEGSVLIRRDAILEKLLIDLAEKNPKWIVGWANGLPEFDLDQKVHIGDKQKILGLHIAGTLIDKWTFAARDCETKARRRAQIQMLGADWREDDEVESEVEEMETVGKRR